MSVLIFDETRVYPKSRFHLFFPMMIIKLLIIVAMISRRTMTSKNIFLSPLKVHKLLLYFLAKFVYSRLIRARRQNG